MFKYVITRGLYGNYQPDGKHRDHIFFAVDRGAIYMNGEKYGIDSQEDLFIENISYSAGKITVYYSNDTSEEFTITKDDLGLSNVTNDAQVRRNELGTPNGVPTLDERGKIKPEFVEGVMNPVVGLQKFLNNYSELEDITVHTSDGRKYFVKETSLIYTKIGNEDGSWDEGSKPMTNTIYNHREADEQGRVNIIYRWDGEQMVEISSTLTIGTVEGTAFEGNRGVKAEQDISGIQARLKLIEEWYEL